MSDKRGASDMCGEGAVDVTTGATACAGVDAATGATVRHEHGVDADGLRVSRRAGAEDAARAEEEACARVAARAEDAAAEEPAGDCPSVEDMERFVDAVTAASWKAPSDEAEAAYRENLDALRTSLPPIMPPGVSIR